MKHIYNKSSPPEIKKSPGLLINLRELEILQKKIETIKKTIEEISPEEIFVFCSSCDRFVPISEWTWINRDYYIPPRGCTEGDYWMESNDFTWRCSHCNSNHRTYGDHEELKEIRKYFGHIETEKNR